MSRSWTNADDFRPPTPAAPPADDDPAACLRGFRGLMWAALLVLPVDLVDRQIPVRYRAEPVVVEIVLPLAFLHQSRRGQNPACTGSLHLSALRARA